LHHDHRTQEILDVLARLGPATAWQVTEQLTWSRGWAAVEGFMRRAALGETAAHMKYLLDHGEVSRGGGTPVRYAGRRAAADG
jgi:hypothetical protein